MGCGIGPAGHRVDTALQFSNQRFGPLFYSSSPAYPTDVFQHVAEMVGCQREDFGRLVKHGTQLGHLPSRNGSNLADGLSQEQVRFRRRQDLLINLVDFLTFAE